MENKVIIMRGVPGSGKSFLVNNLVNEAKLAGKSVVVCSADHFHINEDGIYNWKAENMGKAHKWCKDKFDLALRNDVNLIIVDNTNTRMSEARPYVLDAHSQGYEIEILEPQTEWKYDIKKLLEKGTHNVPRKTLEEMLNRLINYPYTLQDLLC